MYFSSSFIDKRDNYKTLSLQKNTHKRTLALHGLATTPRIISIHQGLASVIHCNLKLVQIHFHEHIFKLKFWCILSIIYPINKNNRRDTNKTQHVQKKEKNTKQMEFVFPYIHAFVDPNYKLKELHSIFLCESHTATLKHQFFRKIVSFLYIFIGN